MKADSLKRVYYSVFKHNSFRHLKVELGYIFHTEKIYDDKVFNQLIEFCKRYHEITGAKPICAIIPPTNSLLNKQLLERDFSESRFLDRIIRLSKYSTIGYHGHFYLNDVPEYHHAIHCNSFSKNDLSSQFNRDINWFSINQIDHHGIYAGGWWFFNQELLTLLISNGFKYDFTFSKAKYFYNQFSNRIMKEFDLQSGDHFYLMNEREDHKMTCIQNFVGMHTTPFPEDFDRNFSKLLRNNQNENVMGVVNSHDYDLDLTNTLKCINYQQEKNNINFISFDELIEKDVKITVKVT